MDKLHDQLLTIIKNESKKSPNLSKHGASYEGHRDKSYGLTNPQLRKIAKTWLLEHRNLDSNDFVSLLNSLYNKSDSSTEKYLAGFLLEYSPTLRRELIPSLLDDWLDDLIGWGQVDSLCQSKFGAEDMMGYWKQWESELKSLNRSEDINKRRASLVLLTKPVRDSQEKRFADLALMNITRLRHEKEILITKAISWLLREMIKHHKATVSHYLKQNKSILPTIAVREVSRKLDTGRK